MSRSLANTPSSGVFLDANVLLEIILGRAHEQKARAVLEKHRGNVYISALSAHLVTHFGQAIVELPVLRQFLQDYIVLPLEAADFEWAFVHAQDKDFEDALQMAVAVRHGCGRFVTMDKTLFAAYKKTPLIHVELV